MANGVEVATISGTQTLANKTLATPRVNSLLDTNGVMALNFVATASAANYWQFTSAAAGAIPVDCCRV